jgi:pimeloyl-ACP methyl ester carboxylesterase
MKNTRIVGNVTVKVTMLPMSPDRRAFMLGGLISLFGMQARAQSQSVPLDWITPETGVMGVERVIYPSTRVGVDVAFHVVKPPNYDVESGGRFPTLYWLHGTGGNRVSLRPMAAYFSAAMARGDLPPCLVVMPNGQADSLWCDSLDGSAPVETILMQEILPLVDTKFRTRVDRRHRLLEGFSMGGFGAGRLGMRHHDQFGAISMLASGPLQATLTRDDGPALNADLRILLLQRLFDGDQARFLRESPRGMALVYGDAVRAGTKMRIAIGGDDFTRSANEEFSRYLVSLNIPHEFIMVPSVGHDARKLIDQLGFNFHREFFGAA